MIISWQRFLRTHPRTVDLVMAAVLFGCSLIGSRVSDPQAVHPHDWWPAVVCTAFGCAFLQVRRERPRLAVVLTVACAVPVAAMGYLPTVLLLGPVMVALYTLADRTDRNTARVYGFATAGLLVTIAVAAGPDDRTLDLTVIAPVFWLLLPLAFGTTGRLQRANVAAVQVRAEYAERTREEEARHRVAEERVRIARELHDVVAHHLALANAQAGTAAHLVDSNPQQARKILAELTGTTSSALRELKATVGLLRQADDPDAPLEPAPGLDRLPELIAAFETGGLTVDVDVEGTRRPLSPGVDLTAYRIVQEALTNVAKHATTRAAQVRLGYSRDRLTITVTDEGGAPVGTPVGAAASRAGGAGTGTVAANGTATRANASAGASTSAASGSASRGFGLIGMRERAQSVGGRFQAGRRPEGGFTVTAELPLDPRDLEEDRTS